MNAYPTRPVRDICAAIEYGYTASSSSDSSAGPHFLRITDIVPDRLDWSSVPFCAIDEKKLAKHRLRTGDIVIARTGATTGWAKYINDPPKAVFASYLVRIRPDNTVDARYVGFVIESSVYKEFIQRHMGGAAQPNANAQVLTSFEIPLPPLQTQRRIAGILSAYDDLIENCQRRIQILEEMARSLYREWFVSFRYPGHESVPLVTSALGEIPQGWEVRKLSELVTTQYGYTESTNLEPVGPKYLRGMDINKTSFIDWSAVPYCPISVDDIQTYKLKVGDVVVIRMADPGKVGIVEQDVNAVFASYLIRVAPKDERISPYFLFYLMESSEYYGWITGASTGTTRKSASASVITEYSFVLPPASTMRQFESKVGVIRSLLTTLLLTSSNLRQTRDLLLPRLMSGRLEVTVD